MDYGLPAYAAGASGTVTLKQGGVLKQIIVHATSDATMTIFGGATITIKAGAYVAFRFGDRAFVAQNNTASPGSQDVVFTGTDSYYVDYRYSPGAAA